MVSPSGVNSTQGRLLVSVPDTGDPNFDLTVVFMIEHDQNGALGLIVNRPGSADLLELLPVPQKLVASPQKIFFGGPVSMGAVLALGRRRLDGSDENLVPVSGPIALVDVEALAEDRVDVDVVRFYNGYSGWAPGQLDAEIAAGGWHIADAMPDDVFCDEPERLWRSVMRRQGGRLAAQALFPEDVSSN